MKKATTITCIFLDIGGVLLTDGWGHIFRKRAAKTFNLNFLFIAQIPAKKVLYIENTPMFVQIAERLGIRVFATQTILQRERNCLFLDWRFQNET